MCPALHGMECALWTALAGLSVLVRVEKRGDFGLRTLDRLSRRYRLAVVSNIDDDLLALTPLQQEFDLAVDAAAVVTAVKKARYGEAEAGQSRGG
jgi:hypothetical protein